ncbi:hypothetical protein GGR56DRAFT_619691 [Xylariaceae sp. FL0804]|nr:hypothetical protein GGR56DRAFT_619691 [Xylariaceae sp. FL0804]
MPALDDGGAANVYNYSQLAADGVAYGPGTGDLWWSAYYETYMLLFQADDAALDNNVYMSYSADLTGGWSDPVSIYQISTLSNGYSYSFHAYPDYDETGKTTLLSWSEYGGTGFWIPMANVTWA